MIYWFAASLAMPSKWGGLRDRANMELVLEFSAWLHSSNLVMVCFMRMEATSRLLRGSDDEGWRGSRASHDRERRLDTEI